MKLITSGLFFIAAALTDLALSQNGGHNLAIGALPLQITGLILLIWGLKDSEEKKKNLANQSIEAIVTTPVD